MTELERTEAAVIKATEILNSPLLIATHLGILCILFAKLLDKMDAKSSPTKTQQTTPQDYQ